MAPHILVFAGSTRSGSVNSKAGQVAAKILALKGAHVTRISLADYPIAIYDGDLEEEKGIPQNALKLARLMSTHDGIVIASPEYNSSIAPLLKNALDWVSRVKKDDHGVLSPYRGKFFAILAASPGVLGGIRGLEHLRAVLRNVGAEVITAQVAIGNAGAAFGDDDMLKDERQAGMMDMMCDSLIQSIRAKAMLDQ